MRAFFFFFLLAPLCIWILPPVHAHDWGKNYSTGRKGDMFESCCGVNDCWTAESLGFPKMKRYRDGSYEVKVGKYWLRYDFPAVHRSEDKKIWICFMETREEPEPLCLFLPPEIS